MLSPSSLSLSLSLSLSHSHLIRTTCFLPRTHARTRLFVCLLVRLEKSHRSESDPKRGSSFSRALRRCCSDQSSSIEPGSRLEFVVLDLGLFDWRKGARFFRAGGGDGGVQIEDKMDSAPCAHIISGISRCSSFDHKVFRCTVGFLC